jgi:hypothetical protein
LGENTVKKLLVLIGITLLLSACGGNESNETPSSKPKDEPKKAEQKEVSNEPPKAEKDEDGNYVLEVAGQKATSEGATAELLKILKVNQIVNIAPLAVTVKDIKIIKLTEMTDDLKQGIELMDGNAVGDEITYVQLKYHVENMEEKNIEWYGLTNLVTDKGEQIDGMMKDFLVDDSDTDSKFLGKVKKEFTDGFVLKDGDISKVKLIFGSSMDADSYQDITPEQQVEYSF